MACYTSVCMVDSLTNEIGCRGGAEDVAWYQPPTVPLVRARECILRG